MNIVKTILSTLTILASFLYTIELSAEQKPPGTIEILMEYPDVKWTSASVELENRKFRFDSREMIPDEKGSAYVKIPLERPTFGFIRILETGDRIPIFLLPGEILHLKLTNSPETDRLYHVDFQGQTRNIQKYLLQNHSYFSGKRLPDLLDENNIGNSVLDSLSLNDWMVEYYTSTEAEKKFVEMFRAQIFAKKWYYTCLKVRQGKGIENSTKYDFPADVVATTRQLSDQFPDLLSVALLAKEMGFRQIEAFSTPEVFNCTQMRKDGDFSKPDQVRSRMESSSRLIAPRKMTAAEVDFIRDCLFLLKGTENYEKDKEKAFKKIFGELPPLNANLVFENLEPQDLRLDGLDHGSNLAVLILYDYNTIDSSFRRPDWMDTLPVKWAALSVDYTKEKWEEGKPSIPSHMQAYHLKGGIINPTVKKYMWYHYPRLVLYNTETQKVVEHIMPAYDRKDLWEEILLNGEYWSEK